MTLINENPNMNIIIVINNQINKTIFGNIKKKTSYVQRLDLMNE